MVVRTNGMHVFRIGINRPKSAHSILDNELMLAPPLLLQGQYYLLCSMTISIIASHV